jgi:tRNA(Ile)-lysidine synthase
MGLLQAFKAFISGEHLFQSKDHLLLAVSGGVDSVVLCELCRQAGYNFSIAHCNFQLRGEESTRDESFVRNLAGHYSVPFHVKHFDTQAYAQQHKCSIQVAARELRYEWFQTLGAKYILTAHHLNDNIETVLMNFFKGTGITGLRGILPKQGNIVRPLLFASKEELKEFATGNNLQWVEDSSNAADKYTRNFIRHKLIPLVTEIFPQAESNLSNNIQRFRESDYLYQRSINKLIKKVAEQKGAELHIPILKLQKTNVASTILFELLNPLGFTSKQTAEALHLLHSETGRYIASGTHRIFKNRNWLIIAPNETTLAEHILIEEGQHSVQFAIGSLQLTPEPIDPSTQPPAPNIAFIDAGEISYPLILRRWQPGDYFYPLGMRKKKKLARFFIDNKLSTTEKEKTWVIESGKKILWIIGRRIDNRFRITPQTKKILKIEWVK